MKKEKENKIIKNICIVNFGFEKTATGFGTTIMRSIDGVKGTSLTIPTELSYKELEIINKFFSEYDLYCDIDNTLRKVNEFRIDYKNSKINYEKRKRKCKKKIY